MKLYINQLEIIWTLILIMNDDGKQNKKGEK